MFRTFVDPYFELVFHSAQLSERVRKKVRANFERGYMNAERGEAGEATRFFWERVASPSCGRMPYVGRTRIHATIPPEITEDTRQQIDVLMKLNPPSKYSNRHTVHGSRYIGHWRGYGNPAEYAGAEAIVRVLAKDPLLVETSRRAIEEFDRRHTYVKDADGKWGVQ